MTRIVSTHYRTKRPPRKRKAAALEVPAANQGIAAMAWFLLALVLIGTVGCAVTDAVTDTVDVFPMNDAAHRLGSMQASFVRTGTGRGPVTIKMADGEVLTGEYRVAFGTSGGTAFSGPWSATAIVIRDGPVQFVARGPKTEMLCRGTNTTMGHGNGECQTYDGGSGR